MNETQGPSEAIDSIDQVARIARLADERAADIVEFLNEETPEVAAHVLVGLPRDRAIEAWLRSDVVQAYDAIVADPTRGLSLQEVRAHLAQAHERATAKV